MAIKTEAIQQERAETQNIIIVRYWQMTRLERLYEMAEHEEEEERKAEIEGSNNALLTNGTPQLALEPPPDYNTSSALTKLPIISLGELDQSLHQIRQSPKDMVQVSDKVIDPLLERWTNWHDIRERKEKRDSGGPSRFTPSVQNLYEEEDERLRQDFHDRDDSPRGYFLEGPTTDWRRPNSVAARREASQLRQKYSRYQPSVSVDSSEVEDEHEKSDPQKRGPCH